MTRPTAIVIGATGLTGRALLKQLDDNPVYDQIIALSRKRAQYAHEKVVAVVCDFESWADKPSVLAEALVAQTRDSTTIHAFCCLGTTIKAAGSEHAFRRVDLAYVVAFAHAVKQLKAQHLGVVSALGASAKSPVFYTRTKGEMESAVSASGVPSVHFVRPSFLEGERTDSRPGERLGIAVTKCLTPVLLGPLKRYRVVNVEQVAAKLVSVAASAARGSTISESETI